MPKIVQILHVSFKKEEKISINKWNIHKKYLIVGQTCTFVLYIRETHGEPDVHSGRIFHDAVHLSANVSGGLLNR